MRAHVLAAGMAFAVAGVAAAVPRPVLAEGPAAAATPSVEDALGLLRSPLLAEREEAIRRLVDAMPAQGASIRSAFQREPSVAVRLALAEVLAGEGSPSSLHVLLDAVAKDARPIATRLRSILLRDAASTRVALAAWAAAHPGELPAGLRALEELVVRAEVHALFVSRKSKSGYTGYYKGQYAPLDTPRYRTVALRTCVHLMEDRAMPVEGIHRTGGFEFVVPPAESVEFAEVQGMAANAVVELTRTSGGEDVDAWAIDRLQDLAVRREQEYQTALWAWIEDRTHALYLTKVEKQGLYADVLQALVLLRPRRYQHELDRLLNQLADGAIDDDADARATILLRLGRYEEAIDELEALIGDRDGMAPAHLHYNLACAYSSWSLDPNAPNPSGLRRKALNHLGLAVLQHRWSDIGWMEQDRDLDPIRDAPQYARLIQHIREFILPPGAAVPGAPGVPPADGRPPK